MFLQDDRLVIDNLVLSRVMDLTTSTSNRIGPEGSKSRLRYRYVMLSACSLTASSIVINN
jgi:hypothetical protein